MGKLLWKVFTGSLLLLFSFTADAFSGNGNYAAHPEYLNDLVYVKNIHKPANPVQRKYTTGPRGGCFYINSAGKKVYVDHSYCNSTSSYSSAAPAARAKKSTGNRSYTTGPRGGCYYINSAGNKVYVSRSYCN